MDGERQARQAVNSENVAFCRSKVRGPLFFHTWTVVDRKSRVRGPLFFDTWTVVDRRFLKEIKFNFKIFKKTTVHHGPRVKKQRSTEP